MPTFSVWMLEAANITVSGGGSLSGITQGDGSHLVGRSITLNNNAFLETRIRDDDLFFDDNDRNQVLDGAQRINGENFRNGTIVEAEYRLVLRDPATGKTYTVIGYNVNNSNPTYATVEGLAFVGPPGAWPPVGVALTVVQASEGPGDFGQPRLPYSGTVVPCFTPGTRIRCPGGPRLIETLAPGDRVCVRGAGPQPLRALARTTVSAAMAAVMPQLAPVTIRAGAFGPGRPGRDLTVSPQHRILVRSARADLMFGTPEVLVAAVHLVDGDAIRQTAPQAVTYLHLVFESHQIVWAEGIETESFLPVAALSPGAPPNLEAEIRTLFPDLAAGGRQATVSRALSGWEARALVA